MLLPLLGFLPCLLAFAQLTDWQARFSIAASAVVSACGFWMTCTLIPTVARLTLRRGLYGARMHNGGDLLESVASLPS